MIVIHIILTSFNDQCLITHRLELNMVLDYWSPIRPNVSDSEHNQTQTAAYTGDGLQLISSVVLCVCLVVCVNLGPKAAISRGEQNRHGWRRRTLLTARLIKFYGGLRRLMAAARGSTYNEPKCGLFSRIQHLECSAGESLPLQNR